MSNVLVLAAHHDDETLGCGATIARMSAQGYEVLVFVLGEGPAARDGNDHSVALRNSVNAIQSLGATLVATDAPGYPDNRFDTVPMLEIAKRIEGLLGEWMPDIVFTHHGGDLNVDHRAVYEATLIATRLSGRYPVRELYTYEVPSSTETAFDYSFHPNVFHDISGEWLERKIAAMQMYETERRAFPHPRSPEALRALAMYRGSQVGLLAAEAFHLVRRVV